jgi:hypothetical protein
LDLFFELDALRMALLSLTLYCFEFIYKFWRYVHILRRQRAHIMLEKAQGAAFKQFE